MVARQHCDNPIAVHGEITTQKNQQMSQQIKDLEVVGKDIVGVELPMFITSENTSEEFSNGRTWGRLLRLRRGSNNQMFFDIGLDEAGNLYINTKNNSASTHVLTISPAGHVTITGDLTVSGKLVHGG